MLKLNLLSNQSHCIFRAWPPPHHSDQWQTAQRGLWEWQKLKSPETESLERLVRNVIKEQQYSSTTQKNIMYIRMSPHRHNLLGLWFSLFLYCFFFRTGVPADSSQHKVKATTLSTTTLHDHLQEECTITVDKTHSQAKVSQVIGLYIVMWTPRPAERLIHCAYLWDSIAGSKVPVYIMNLLISAHIQLVHIWILYVCFSLFV